MAVSARFYTLTLSEATSEPTTSLEVFFSRLYLSFDLAPSYYATPIV